MSSFSGIVIGIILFVASFGVLYWNEGRLDLSNIAKTAPEISSVQNADPSLNGKLVSTSGVIKVSDQIGDGLYVKPAPFVALSRHTEMYAWEEQEESSSTKNVGGSETTTKTYNYVKTWQSSPESSANFKYPEGHLNPVKTLSDTTLVSKKAMIGVYPITLDSMDLPITTPVSLTTQNVTPQEGAIIASARYMFVTKNVGATLETPQVGDVRVSYDALYPETDVTLFGKLNGTGFSPFFDAKNNKLYRLFIGGRDQAIVTLHGEYTMMIWLFRGIGFLMMWLGLMSILGPISVLLDVLPIFGSISRGLISGITLLASLILSAVTILIAMVLHNIWALLIVLAVTVSGIFFFMGRLKNKPTSTVPAK